MKILLRIPLLIIIIGNMLPPYLRKYLEMEKYFNEKDRNYISIRIQCGEIYKKALSEHEPLKRTLEDWEEFLYQTDFKMENLTIKKVITKKVQ